ncbi:replicative DNA helicase [Candidatus Uhrbacteria bacterium]|jgi:replicative DNA helicase|nr:replicative DNA helicase [Candidatus Uhrbacteria bacterium]
MSQTKIDIFMAVKIPPHNLEAEESLLGAILVDQESLMKVLDVVHAEDFYKESHRIVFDIMLDLFERHQPIDLLTVGNRLEEKKQLVRVGGRAQLVELANTVTTSANIKNYAQIIQKKSTLRKLLKAASEITELGYDENEDIDLVIDSAEQKLFDVSSGFIQKTFVAIRSVLTGAFDRIDELHRERGKLRGIATGFKGLDNLLAGFQKADLIILAARPSVGKTSLALDIIRNVSVRQNAPVGFFSLEMAKEQLVDRLICAEANVDLWKLRTGRLSDRDDDFPRIGEALASLSEAPIYIDDTPVANIMSLRAKARRLKAEHGLSLIVIDYLQLMEGRSRNSENRVNEVAEISRGLKQIGRELEVPVLALAQLSRAVESIKPAIPKLSHLRESGSIEQDADVVLFLYRKAADRNYQPDELTPEEKNLAELHIAKHRNGPTGIVRLFFDKTRASFKNMENHSAPAPNPVPVGAPSKGPNPNVGLPPGIPPKG